MRLMMCTAVCILLTRGYAQQSFLSLRYDEDYSYLAADTSRNWYHKLKYTSLSDEAHVSAGGEIRYLAQYFQNEDWGDAPKPAYTSFYTRYLLHGHLKWRDRLAIFAQLSSTFANGRITPNRSIDENRADVHQAFLEISLFHVADYGLLLRAGRQEFSYGSQRIIGVREGPNNRQSFDAVKLLFKSARIKADFFISWPVRIHQGTFDDVSNLNQSLWSTYVVIQRLPRETNLDIYYIGFSDDRRTFDAGTAAELRHSVGFRAWRKSRPFQFDIEALYQFGDFGASQINAYTASINTSYRFTTWRLQPAFGVKTEVISGDLHRDDVALNTFNPLFPRGAYFGLAALIGPSNLIDFHPSIDLNLHKNITLTADFDVFWRYSINDGIYGPNAALLYGSKGASAFIGRQAGLSLEFTPNKHLTCIPEFMWFGAGDYLEDVSTGKDVLFGAITFQYRY